jgi:o-succinylbenzoate synthase
MLTASYIKHTLKFLNPVGTSRGVLREKESWFIKISDSLSPDVFGIGECSLIPGLSTDRLEDFESVLKFATQNIEILRPNDLQFRDHPSIQFGFETAMQDLNTGGKRILKASDFSTGKYGVPINGLIWMGEKNSMKKQVREKIDQGFRILKLKVGALNFDDELDILKSIRENYTAKDLEIRLDANGAWEKDEAIEKLKQLSNFNIHSIEQPISAGYAEDMAELVAQSIIPIALDEELNGAKRHYNLEQLLETIQPAYIILKPSLLGGIKAAEAWIVLAEKLGISWWITSALESNIGLNAIAQWTATLQTSLPQGLGTGALFSNNISSPLEVRGDKLYYLPENNWDLTNLNF